jgi:hypothetical protein
MQLQISIQRNVQYTGKKALPGRICFDERDRMCVQVGYCPDCRGKIIMSIPDARKFAKLYAGEASKPFSKLLIRSMNKRRT